MNQVLKSIIEIRKHLKDVSIEPFGFKGTFLPKSCEDVELLQNVKTHLRDCFYKKTDDDVDLDSIQFNSEIIVQIDLKDSVGFYETINLFIQSHKLELPNSTFYINENDYFEGISESPIIVNYKINILLVEFLKSISDYNKQIYGELELFFYKSEKGVALKIDYNHSDLIKDMSNIRRSIIELTEQFNQPSDSNERKQIFVNELITILNHKGCTYSILLENWYLLIDNYKKSFSLYLSGFSFEKVKTASVEYFHDLTDRIHSTVIKFSTYIFGIPISYILLIRFLDFSGGNFVKDSFLLLLGIIFFILIWFIILKSINDALEAIDRDILSFKNKIAGDAKLNAIWDELDEQSKTIIPRQKRKLKLVKGLTIIIVVLLLMAYFTIHYNVLIKPALTHANSNKEIITNKDSLLINNSIFFKDLVNDTIDNCIESEKIQTETDDSIVKQNDIVQKPVIIRN